MKRSAIAAIAMACAALTAAAPVPEVTLVRDVQGPEGPLFIGGNLYFVAYVGSTLSKWDGKRVTVLNADPSCDHNGLALTAKKTFLVACDADQGAVLELDMQGKQLRRWDGDSSGGKFDGGLNDLAIAADGGAYVTLTVAPHAPPGSATGKVYYLAPGAKGWTQVADGLRAANRAASLFRRHRQPDRTGLHRRRGIRSAWRPYNLPAWPGRYSAHRSAGCGRRAETSSTGSGP